MNRSCAGTSHRPNQSIMCDSDPVIGFKRGTGGSSGVGFLQQALALTFFPELFDVRTSVGVEGREPVGGGRGEPEKG